MASTTALKEHLAMATQAAEPSVLKREASDFWEFIVVLFFDTLKNLAILGALSLLFIAVKQLRAIGMQDKYLDPIEALHFYLTISALAWIALVFFAKMVARSIKK